MTVGMIPGNAGEQLMIKRVIMIKTGHYQPQVARPFNAVVLEAQNLKVFEQATQGGRQITPTSIASVAGQMIEPAAMSNQIINIKNGWEQERVRLIIEAQYVSPAGHTKTFLVQGYSDQPGFTQSGYIDPMMLIYMNNVLVMQDQSYIDPTTGVPVRRMIDSSQMLYKAPTYNYESFNYPGQQVNQMQTLLPSEVVQHIGVLRMTQQIGSVADFRTSFNESPMVKSNRENALASRYLSRTVNALSNQLQNAEHGQSALLDATNAAATQIADTPIAMDNFINTIEERSPFKEQGYITWGDLVAIFPAIDSVTTIIDRSFQQQLLHQNNNAQLGAVTSMAMDSAFRDVNNLESWTSASRETVVATTLSHSIPAIMMENFLATMQFSVTNMNMTGQPQFTILQDPQSGRPMFDTFIDGMDMTRFLQRFHMTIVNEIMANISYGNQHSYMVFMNVNILGDTYIKLSLNGGPQMEYLMPSFCDALVAPVVTFNPIDKDRLSAGVLQMVNAVATQPMMQQPMQQPYNPMY